MAPDQKAEQQLQRIHRRIWAISAAWSVLFFAAASFYVAAYDGSYRLNALVESLEVTAAMLIGVSYAFGSFTYYTDFLDHDLIYRKYFGLVGFIYLAAYTLLWLASPDPIIDLQTGRLELSWLLLAAMLLTLAGMTLVGNYSSFQRRHPHAWRNCLRAGYIIYAFWIPRSVYLYAAAWRAWSFAPATHLPPASLLITVLAICVVLFRLSVYPVKILKKVLATKSSTPPASLNVTKKDPPGSVSQMPRV